MFNVGDRVICHYKYGGIVKGEIVEYINFPAYQYKVLYFTYTSNGDREYGWFHENNIELDNQYYRKLKLNKLCLEKVIE